MKAFNIFLILLLLTLFTYAETNPDSHKFEIMGKVVDKQTGKAIEYATVALYKIEDTELTAGSITDINGSFKLNKLEDGIYKIEIRFIGYKNYEAEISIDKNHYDIGVVQLEQDLSLLGAVEITAEKPNIEYKIDKQVLNASSGINAANGSAIDVLKQSPSINVDNEDNVTLRGSGDFILLIDDKIVVANRNEILKQIPASQIENIEIMTNPSARYDAGGASGIINIRTKKIYATFASGLINLRAGYRDKYNGDVIYKNMFRKTSYQITGNISSQDYYSTGQNDLRTINTESEESLLSDVNRLRKRFSAYVRPEIESQLGDNTTLLAGLSWMNFGFHSYITSNYTHHLNQIERYYVAHDDFLLAANQYQGDVSLIHKFDTNGHSIKINALYLNWIGINDQNVMKNSSNSDFIGDTLVTGRKYYEGHYMHQADFKADYVKPFQNGFKFETGVSSNYRIFFCDKDMTLYNIPADTWQAESIYSGIHQFSENMNAAYSLLSGQVKKINVQGGLRLQYYTRITDVPVQNLYIDYRKLYYFPSLHLSLNGKQNRQWQLSYSRRINLPNDWFTSPVPFYNDGFVVQTGNPALEPELFDVAEINHIRFIKQHMLNISLFSRFTHDAVERVTVIDTNGVYYIVPYNLSEKAYYGSEIGTSIKINSKLNLNISGSLYKLFGRVRGPLQHSNYEQFSYSSRFNLQYRPVSSFSAELSGYYQGAENEAYGIRKPMYGVNVAFRKTFLNNKLSLTLSANDIFRTDFYTFTETNENFKSSISFRREYPMVFLGLSYKFNDYKQNPNNNTPNPSIQGL